MLAKGKKFTWEIPVHSLTGQLAKVEDLGPQFLLASG